MTELRPLSGMSVLAVEQLMALPFGTQILADLGADVIAVNPVGPGRPDAAPWRERTGRGKRQITVKFNEPAGQALLRELAGQVDVFAENFRPGVMDRYGLGWQALHALHPRLIYASVSGFGHTDFLPSPHSHLAAYGSIGEAMSGSMDAMRKAGSSGGAPFALGDIGTSVFATIGILAALRHRDMTGQGQYVDVAMADALFAIAELPFVRHSLSLDEEGPAPERLSGYPIGVFSARDAEFCLIVLNEGHWEALCRLTGHSEWLTELAGPLDRAAVMGSLIKPALNAWASERAREDVIEQCRQAGLAVAPVNRPQDIAVDPHFVARKMLQPVIRPDGRPLQVVGSPIKLSACPPPEEPVRIAGPGVDNREVLVERFGFSPQRYEQLVEDGVVGREPGAA